MKAKSVLLPLIISIITIKLGFSQDELYPNLVKNGDFEDGVTGFQSDFIWAEEDYINWGYYVITDNSAKYLGGGVFLNPVPKTGKYYFIDMNNMGKQRLWYTTVNVKPNTTYEFSCILANVCNEFPAPGFMALKINGESICPPKSLSNGTNAWTPFKTHYKTGPDETSLEISIVDEIWTLMGNDVALDNVEFREIPAEQYDPGACKTKFEKLKEEEKGTQKEVAAVVRKQQVIKEERKQEEEKKKEEIAMLEKKPEPVVEKKPEPVVEKKPEPIVEEKKPEPVVEEKKPEPVVEEKKPEPVVEKKPEPVVEKKKPEPVVEKKPEPIKIETPVKERKPIQNTPVVTKREVKPVAKIEEKPKPIVIEEKPKPVVKVSPPVKKDFDKNMKLEDLEKDAHLELKHIYFERSKFDLLETSKPELNNLVDFMKRYPTVKIRLEGHTENIGDSLKNVELSENRVKAVKKYLVDNGIADKRVEWIGYGGSKASNTGDGKLNRRVEAVLIEK